jgi:hypothetical protein
MALKFTETIAGRIIAEVRSSRELKARTVVGVLLRRIHLILAANFMINAAVLLVHEVPVATRKYCLALRMRSVLVQVAH